MLNLEDNGRQVRYLLLLLLGLDGFAILLLAASGCSIMRVLGNTLHDSRLLLQQVRTRPH